MSYGKLDAFFDRLENRRKRHGYDFTRIRQTGSLEDFHFAWDLLTAKVDLCEDYMVDIYLRALKPEIERPVRMFNPSNIIDAQRLAKIEERILEKQRHCFANAHVFAHMSSSSLVNNSKAGPPKNVNFGCQKQNRGTRQLTHAEEADHREKNLCFYCHEKLSPEHNCPERCKFQLYFVEVDSLPEKEFEEIKEIDEGESEQPLTSTHAIEGNSGSRKDALGSDLTINRFGSGFGNPKIDSSIPLNFSPPTCDFWKQECNNSDSKKDEEATWQKPVAVSVRLEKKNTPTICMLHVWFKGKLVNMLVGSHELQCVMYLTEDNIQWLKAWFLHDLSIQIYLNEDNIQWVKHLYSASSKEQGKHVLHMICPITSSQAKTNVRWKKYYTLGCMSQGQISSLSRKSQLLSNTNSRVHLCYSSPITKKLITWALMTLFLPTHILLFKWYRGGLIKMLCGSAQNCSQLLPEQFHHSSSFSSDSELLFYMILEGKDLFGKGVLL